MYLLLFFCCNFSFIIVNMVKYRIFTFVCPIEIDFSPLLRLNGFQWIITCNTIVNCNVFVLAKDGDASVAAAAINGKMADFKNTIDSCASVVSTSHYGNFDKYAVEVMNQLTQKKIDQQKSFAVTTMLCDTTANGTLMAVPHIINPGHIILGTQMSTTTMVPQGLGAQTQNCITNTNTMQPQPLEPQISTTTMLTVPQLPLPSQVTSLPLNLQSMPVGNQMPQQTNTTPQLMCDSVSPLPQLVYNSSLTGFRMSSMHQIKNIGH